MNFGRYFEVELGKHLAGEATLPAMGQLTIRLFYADIPGEGISNGVLLGEIVGGGYEAKTIELQYEAVNRGGHNFVEMKNTSDISWIATSNWASGPIVGDTRVGMLAIYSPNYAGPIFYGALSTPVNVNAGDILRFPAGSIIISID